MKTKKRQQQYEGWRRKTPLSVVQDAFFAVFGRSPKQLMALLEEDAQLQAARFEQLEEAILLPLRTLEPVLVPAVDDGPIEYPDDPQESSMSAGVDYAPRRPARTAAAPVDRTPVSVPIVTRFAVAAPVAPEEPAAVVEPPQVIDESASAEAEEASAASPRRDYGSMMTTSRIRRRVML